eukprot:7372242-Alexandrium_andersonii.AAC.1
MSGGAHRAQVRGDGEALSAMKGPYSLLQMTQRPPSFLEGGGNWRAHGPRGKLGDGALYAHTPVRQDPAQIA